MTAKTKAILLSAFVCPGIGQLAVGRKRGILIIAGVIVLVLLLAYNIVVIVVQEMPPELMLSIDPFDYAVKFLRIRQRVYSENIFVIIILLALWLGNIIDLAVIKIPEKPSTSSDNKISNTSN